MSTIYKEFGKKIRTYRKEKGLTGSELANKLNISIGHISNIENGKKDIFNLELLNALSKELDVPLEKLLHFKPIEITTLTIHTDNTKLNINKTDTISDEAISSINYHLDTITTAFLHSGSEYNYSDEAMETIANHIIEEFDFINKLESLKSDCPTT